jgi:hypothetical protein
MTPTTRHLAALLPALGLTQCIASTAAAAVDPAASVFQPTFIIDGPAVEAGKGFVFHPEGCATPVLVTALRVLGIGGGLPAQIQASEFQARVRDLTIERIASPAMRLSLTAISVTPTDAAPCCDRNAATGPGDFAAFVLPASLARWALPASSRPPAAGDHVFLLSPGGPGRLKALRHEAVIESRASGYLFYEYLEPDLELDAPAGAPIVNATGELVALHVAREMQGRRPGRGVANPVGRWLEPLRQACRAAETSRGTVD